MAARALASATISFGLVSIPIKVFTTSESGSSIHFNLLHKCGTRLKQQYVCPKDEVVVARDEMVKGYEFAKGQYVLFTDEELKALEEEASKLIEIVEFLPADQVDPLYFEKTYYLGPDKGGDKPYRLLSRAMRETKRCAVATWASRGKQYVVLLRPFEDGLALQQLRWSDEIKSFDEVDRGSGGVDASELELAKQLIEQIAVEAFRPEQFEDTVKQRLEEVIAKKVEGEEVTLAPSEAPQAQIIDLMEALKASLDGEDAKPAPKRVRSKKVQPGRSRKKAAKR